MRSIVLVLSTCIGYVRATVKHNLNCERTGKKSFEKLQLKIGSHTRRALRQATDTPHVSSNYLRLHEIFRPERAWSSEENNDKRYERPVTVWAGGKLDTSLEVER